MVGTAEGNLQLQQRSGGHRACRAAVVQGVSRCRTTCPRCNDYSRDRAVMLLVQSLILVMQVPGAGVSTWNCRALQSLEQWVEQMRKMHLGMQAAHHVTVQARL